VEIEFVDPTGRARVRVTGGAASKRLRLRQKASGKRGDRRRRRYDRVTSRSTFTREWKESSWLRYYERCCRSNGGAWRSTVSVAIDAVAVVVIADPLVSSYHRV